jgi:hypothetical protein
MIMRRFVLSASCAIIVLAAAMPARGGDNPNYDPEWAISLKGGAIQTDVSGIDAAPAFGGEVSVNDPFTTPVIGKVRHMFSINHMDHDGLELNTLEWNAHWVFETHRNFWLGAGPGIGYVWADGRNLDDSVAAQFGMSATYVEGHALFGFESRYQWTSGDSADNWLTMIKLGYQF